MLLGVTHQDPAAAVLLETQEDPSLIRQVLIALLGAAAVSFLLSTPALQPGGTISLWAFL